MPDAGKEGSGGSHGGGGGGARIDAVGGCGEQDVGAEGEMRGAEENFRGGRDRTSTEGTCGEISAL